MPATQGIPSGGQNANPQALNNAIRNLILSSAIRRVQQIYSATVVPANNPTLTVQLKNVGLVTRLIVEIVGTLTNGAGGTSTLTDTGVANMISQVVVTDFQNQTRIQTTGLHLALLASAKRRRPFSATADWNKATGNNLAQQINVNPATWPVFTAPPTLAANAVGTVRSVIEIPFAYTNKDLRGAMYAGVINANAYCNLTLNQNVFAAALDYTNAVYQGQAGTFTSVTVTVYQEYLDQLPVNPQTRLPLTPDMDLSVIYGLYNTNLNSFTANQDFPIQFANFQSFFSEFVIYNNSGGAGGRAVGTDMNYLALQSANSSNLWKVDPLEVARWNRESVQSDLPAGFYYINHRERPIETQQYGNMELILNTITAGAQAYVNVYWEVMKNVNNVSSQGSLTAS